MWEDNIKVNHQETRYDTWTGLIWIKRGTNGWILWIRSLTVSLHQIQKVSSLVETIWAPRKWRCSMETDMMLCKLVCLSALVSLLDIRYFSAFFFLPFFFQLSFTFCLHIPSSFGTKQHRMSPTLASSCVVNFMDVIMDAWRRQWAMILFPLGLLDRTLLDIQLPKSEIINSCWPVEWPPPHVSELISWDITYNETVHCKGQTRAEMSALSH